MKKKRMEPRRNDENASASNRKPTRVREGALKNTGTFDEFCLWFALPKRERYKLGIETQEQFAEYHGVRAATISEWKKRREFLPRLKQIREMWGQERTQDIIEAIYDTAMKRDRESPQAQKLWLQYVEDWSEKTEVSHSRKVVLTVNDIRFIIEGFPPEMRAKFYGYIREIVDTASALRASGRLENGTSASGTGSEPTYVVLNEADHDAQNVPDGKQPDAMAESDPRCLRRDLEWSVQPRDHQSAARWW